MGRLSEREQRDAMPDHPWKFMIPDPHPAGNCGPLMMGDLPPDTPCPTCGIIPDAAQEPQERTDSGGRP